jgi:hypothetical protein
VPPPEADHVTLVFEVPLTVAENCCVLPVATEALLGLIDTATFALELVADEPEETPQPTRSNIPTSTQRTPATIRRERLFLVPVLSAASPPTLVAIILGYQDATFDALTQSIESAVQSWPIDHAESG